MTGGSISDNRAKTGGGIYSEGAINLTGGSISSNEADENAGGIAFFQGTALNVSGAPSVTGNTAPRGKNILLYADAVLTIASALDAEAILDVATLDVDMALTSGLEGKGTLDNFTYNENGNGNLEVGADDGELHFKKDAADVWVSDWQALQNAINADEYQGKTIGLQNDIQATEDDDRLHLVGKNVTIVLNSNTLDRHLDDSDSDGHVFELSENSSLTIRDSSGSGVITGGYAEHGGAINIHEGSTCTIEGGIVKGNRADDSGGGIFVYGTLIMTGGYVTGNEAEDCGGIYIHENGNATLENVTIANNTASEHGGGAINNKGVASLTNCVIKNNHADAEGGGLYNGNKEMTISNCTISGNSAPNGGGICAFGTMTLENTTLEENTSEERGGAVYAHVVFTMNGGSVKNNTAMDCGGIYNDAGTIVLEGVQISGNRATEDGGAGVNNKGMATISNCTISGNVGNAEGGGIYANDESQTVITDSSISNNEAGSDGGALCSAGVVVISNSSIINNKAGHSAGGIIMNSGNASMDSCLIRGNEASGLGGGVYVNDDATVSLVGGTIIGNKGFQGGGGIWVSEHASALNVEGALVVSENEGGGDVYLRAGNKIKLSAVLQNGAKIGVYQEDDLGTPFTEGYAAKNPGVDPAEYFFSNAGYDVFQEGDEAVFKIKAIDEKPFIETNSQVVRDYGSLTGANWMAGISGERRLNEINMPGTHDSGTASVEGNVSTGDLSIYTGLIGAALGLVTGGIFTGIYMGLDTPVEVSDYFAKFANCQTAFIDEQLEQGIRSLDIRLNTYYAKHDYPVKKRDDGESLYLLHGKDPTAGSYFCKDHNDEFLTFKETLEWIKDFLKKHPTETVIMNVQIDSVDDVYDEGMERIRAHLRDLSMEINPSTGESYLYMEDGVFGAKYTAYPQLKDCRGKIVLGTSEEDANLIGGLVTGVGLREVDKPEGSYKDDADGKILNLTNFYGSYGGRDLPTNLDRHIDYYYSAGTNGTDTRIPPEDTPLDIAEDVIAALFDEGGVLLNREGTYLGLVNMDGANARINKLVWSTNFFDGLEYCTVTVKSGFGEQDTKVYTVIKGTPITIPDCIYDTPSSTGVYFEGWDDNPGDDTRYQPGDDYVVERDVVFTAQWSNDASTPISVIWKDGVNKDSLRPDLLKVTVNNQDEVVVTKGEKWRHVVPGQVDSVAPVMEGELASQYTSSVEKVPLVGFVITLTHTPGTTVDVSGSILWKDYDNKDGKRPDKVVLHLFANGSELPSTEATAPDWTFDFGDQPVYLNGEAVAYHLTQEGVDGYATAVTGYVVTNIIHTASRQPTGFVIWADGDDEKTRPKSVTVNLLKDGVKIDSTSVSANREGEWPFYFDMGDDDSAYTITQDAMENYETVIRKDGVERGVTYVVNMNEAHEHTPDKTTVTIAEATCDEKGSQRVIESCTSCGELFSDKVEETPALGHDWKPWNTLREATDTEAGVKVRFCSRDALHQQFRAIPKTGHVHGLVAVAAKAATCTEDGNIAYWKCVEGEDPCGLCFKDQAAKQWIHQEGTVIHASGHAWGAWEVVREATESSWGIEKRTCANDANHAQLRVIPKKAHEHGLVHVDAKAATCTEDGNIEYWKCTQGEEPCGLSFTDAAGTQVVNQEGIVVPAIGHAWGAWSTTTPATETQEGLETRVCAHDATHVQTRVIPRKNHTHGLVYVKAQAATCTEDGTVEYWACEQGENPCHLCFKDSAGAEWVHQEGLVVHALGHDWNEATYAWNANNTQVTAMRVCKRDASHVERETVSVTKVETKPPTCTEAGSALCVSSLFASDGFMPQVKKDVLPALGHDWDAPTYEWADDGSTVSAKHSCKRDGCAVTETEVASDDDGTIVETVTKPATCTEAGELTLTATFANGAFLPQVATAELEPLGHEWGEWTEVEPATESSEGSEERTCTRCGEVQTRVTPAEIEYRFTRGDGAEWTKGSGKDLTFTIKRSFDDSETFSRFLGVEVDGEEVSPSNYQAEAGSVVLAMKASFLQSLPTGEHEITAFFDDGSADASFSVEPTPSKKEKKRPKRGTVSPKTGDRVPWLPLTGIGVVALAVLLFAWRQRRKEA